MEVEAVDEECRRQARRSAGTEGVKVNALIAVLAADGEDVAAAASGAGSAAPAPKSCRNAEGRSENRSRSTSRPQQPASARHRLAPAAASTSGNRTFSRRSRVVWRRKPVSISQPLQAPARMAASSKRRRSRRCRWWHQGCICRCSAGCRIGSCRSAEGRIRRDRSPAALFEPVPTNSCRMTACARSLPSALSDPSRPCRTSASASIASSMRCWRCAPGSTTPLPCKGWRAGLQAVGQHGHQGHGACAAPRRSGCQRVLDRDPAWSSTNADVGVAVSIPGGLITPIIRKAEKRPCRPSPTRCAISASVPGPQLKPGGISGRHHVGLQHGHDGRQALRSRDQSAARNDTRGQRGRAAPCREEQQLALSPPW